MNTATTKEFFQIHANTSARVQSIFFFLPSILEASASPIYLAHRQMVVADLSAVARLLIGQTNRVPPKAISSTPHDPRPKVSTLERVMAPITRPQCAGRANTLVQKASNHLLTTRERHGPNGSCGQLIVIAR